MSGYMILVRTSARLAAPSPNKSWQSDKGGHYPITGYTLIALKHSYLYRLRLSLSFLCISLLETLDAGAVNRSTHICPL